MAHIFYPPPQPTQRQTTAPVPAQGDQPPPWSPAALYLLRQSWNPPDPPPAQLPLTLAPTFLARGDQPPAFSWANLAVIVRSWEPPFVAPPPLPSVAVSDNISIGGPPTSGDIATPGATVTVTLPAGALCVLTAVCGGASSGRLDTAPAGWTKFTDGGVGGVRNLSIQVYWTLAGNANLTFGVLGSPSTIGWECQGFNGADAVHPIDGSNSLPDGITGSSSLTLSPSSANSAGDWAVAAFCDFNNGVPSIPGFVAAENAAVSRSAALLYSTAPLAAGAVGPFTLTSSASAVNQVLLGSLFTLKVATSAPGAPPLLSVRPSQAVIRQSWEPPDPLPAQRPLALAPLALTYGDQPPRYSPAGYLSLVLSWNPPDPQPAQRPLLAATASLARGDRPPAYSSSQPLALVLSWVPPDPPPRQLPLLLAPLTLTYGDQPPPYSVLPQASLRQQWEPGPPQPYQLPARPATAALPTGQQPPRYSVLQVAANRQSWEPPFQYPQVLQGTAAWNFPPPNQPPPATAANLFVALASWLPPDPAPPRDPKKLAPLTLTYGQQPPRYSPASYLALVQSWAPPWTGPQSAAPNAALTFTPPAVNNPPGYSAAPLMGLVLSWTPPPPQPRQLPSRPAVLAIPAGTQPPALPAGPLLAVLASWLPPPPAPWQPPPRRTTTGPPPGVGVKRPLLARVPDPADRRRMARFTEELSAIVNALSREGQLVQFGASGFRVISTHNDDRPPTMNDDAAAGFGEGSMWLDRSAGHAYLCTSAAAGAAVWKLIV